jgi:multiple sugar transport system permease protein
MPFILLRSASKAPASVAIYTFFNEVGIPLIGLIAAYSFIYTVPVVILYLVVNRKFGFRFYGGIKG